VFLAIALGLAEAVGARDIFLGVNALDYSGYPDCRPEFLRAFEDLARVATAAGAEKGERFRVHAPLLEMTKADIVRRGRELDVDFALTHTCYDPVVRGGTARTGTERGDAGLVGTGRGETARIETARSDTVRSDTVRSDTAREEHVLACGRCDACRLRLKGFAEAGIVDPIAYAG
jgi:7-cyano-7-deazaguanine synthase